MMSLIYIPDDTPSTLTHKLTNLYEMIEMQHLISQGVALSSLSEECDTLAGS